MNPLHLYPPHPITINIVYMYMQCRQYTYKVSSVYICPPALKRVDIALCTYNICTIFDNNSVDH